MGVGVFEKKRIKVYVFLCFPKVVLNFFSNIVALIDSFRK